MKTLPILLAGFLVAACYQTLCAESPIQANMDWPSFRGPNGKGSVLPGDGVGTLPNSWSERDYAWRVPLGARDVGSIAVAGGRAHLLSFDPKASSLTLLAIDLEGGSTIWKKTFPIGQYHLHARNSYAASTPTISGERIYISYADDDHTWLRCLTMSGEEVWARDFGPWQSDHGFGTSPAVVGSLVVLYDSQQADELPPGKSASHERMIAVDAATGEDRWITPLKATRTCYGISTAFRSTDGTTQVINAGTGNGMFGIDAETGKLIWELPVFDKRVVSTPIVVGDIAIAACGSGGGGNSLVAVKIPSTEDQKPELLYRLDRAAPYVPTSAVDGEHLMMVSDNGIASRVRITDGEVVWSQRIGGNYGASPVVVGDKMLVIALDGTATIIECGDKFKKLGEVALGGTVGASPALARGKLFLRIDDELCCLPLSSRL